MESGENKGIIRNCSIDDCLLFKRAVLLEESLMQDLDAWIKENKIDDCLLFKKAAEDQLYFINYPLYNLIFKAGDEITPVKILSNHQSKSITLPVYWLERKDLGLTIILRDNFYNWKMSVISKNKIRADFSGLFKTTLPKDPEYSGDPLRPVYFEGFPESFVFGYYNDALNNTPDGESFNFSAEIFGKYQLYTAVFLIMNSLKNK